MPDGETAALAEWFFRRMLEELGKKNVPYAGKFKPVQVWFAIPGTENLGALEIESLSREPGDRLLKVSVLRKGTDRAYSHFLRKGSSEALKAYLEEKACFDGMWQSVWELSSDVDRAME